MMDHSEYLREQLDAYKGKMHIGTGLKVKCSIMLNSGGLQGYCMGGVVSLN